MALTYEESGVLMNDFAFRSKVKVAILKYATYILNEPTGTPAHSARVRWAQNSTLNPDVAAQTVQPSAVMDPGIQEAGMKLPPETGSAATDAQIQAAVETVVDRIL